MTTPHEGIAVVGLDLKIPGNPTFHHAMQTAIQGHTNTGRIAETRLHDSSTGTTADQHHEGGYFEQIDQFDNAYFHLSTRAAESMDPYQRECLLSSARAIADAGLESELPKSRTGVYGSCNGSQQSEYARLQSEHGLTPDLMGNLAPSIAARISNVFDLNGPAVMADTACSSSLYALALACADLRAGTVDVAIVTSANLYVRPGRRDAVAVNIVSERSQTRTFDLAADGASVGEGVATLVLKRVADVDAPFHAEIVGWASNQDGRTATMSSPNPAAQVRVIEEAWGDSLDPSQLGVYVAHGTGTSVGDSIELEGLSEASTFHSLSRQSVPLLAPKSNFGHLDAASGLLSVCFAIASSVSGKVPPHPSFVAPLLSEGLIESPFYIPVVDQIIPPRSLAAVSAFGMTGTNVHVVVRGGTRLNQEPESATPVLNLERFWFAPHQNTFSKSGAPEATEAFNVLSRLFEIETYRDWEIAEHRVQGSPLMVGTSVFEAINALLDGSRWQLSDYDLVDLHLHRPLSASAPRVNILASLDTDNMRGHLQSREGDLSWTTWATFRLRARQPDSRRDLETPSDTDLYPVDVSTSVGDDDFVDVSSKWAVVSSMRVTRDGNSGLLELTAPFGHAHDFAQYAFYPALMDAALNGMNRTLCPDTVLLPWMCDQVTIHVPRLIGHQFHAHIRKRTLTVDDFGHIVLTVDADLKDTQGMLVVSVRGYRVKNQIEANHSKGSFNALRFTPHQPAPSLEETVYLVPSDSSGLPSEFADSKTILYSLGKDQFSREAFGDAQKAVIVLPEFPNDNELDNVLFDFGHLLLQVHLNSRIDHVTVVCPGAFEEGRGALVPAHRALSALAYSLRTELRFDVAVVDAATSADSLALLSRVRPAGLNRLLGNGTFQSARFERMDLAPSQEWGDDEFSVVVVGASSGIGHAYAEYLVTQYPNINVIGVGRRTEAQFSSERVTYIQADITSAADVARLGHVASAARYVVNLAGEPSDGLFIAKDRAEFNSTMRSKVRGSQLLLDEFVAATEVIFVSSVAGVVGAMGQAEYAAANAYQMALAQQASTTGRKVRSIALSGWKDIGMAADLEDDVFEKVGADEGILQLHAYVTSTADSAFVFRAKPYARSYSPLFATPTAPSLELVALEQTKAASHADGDALRLVRDAWDVVLGPGRYDADTSFFEYGGDSISIVQLCDALNNSCGEVFDVTTLFSSATINKQADFLRESYAEKSALISHTPDISDIFRIINNTEEAS